LLVAAARAINAAAPTAPLLVVQHGGGGGAFARSVHLERPRAMTIVVDLPFDANAAARVLAELRTADGYVEAHYHASGGRRVPVLRLLPSSEPGPVPLGASDVLLVTGGGKGIAAECALALARDSGAALALVGRSSPERDAELNGNLERLRAA